MPPSLPIQLELPGRNWCQIAGQRRVHAEAEKGMPVSWPAQVPTSGHVLPPRDCANDQVVEVNGKMEVLPAPTLAELCEMISRKQPTPYHPRSAFRTFPRRNIDDGGVQLLDGNMADADDEADLADRDLASAATHPINVTDHPAGNHGPAQLLRTGGARNVSCWILCRGCLKWNQANPGTVDETDLKGRCPSTCVQCTPNDGILPTPHPSYPTLAASLVHGQTATTAGGKKRLAPVFVNGATQPLPTGRLGQTQQFGQQLRMPEKRPRFRKKRKVAALVEATNATIDSGSSSDDANIDGGDTIGVRAATSPQKKHDIDARSFESRKCTSCTGFVF